MGQLPWRRNPLEGCLAWAMLAFFLVALPIYGVMRNDLFAILIGPAFVLFYLFLAYLISGHWLRFFRRRNDE